MNPFNYGLPAKGVNFCARPEEAALLQLVQTHARVLVTGHSAVGKTSLVDRLSLHGYYLVAVDLKYTMDLPSLEKALVKSLISAQQSFSDSKEVMRRFKEYRPRMELNAYTQDLEYSIEVPANFQWDRVHKLLKELVPFQNTQPLLVLDNVSAVKDYREKEVLLNLLATLANYAGKAVLIDTLDAFKESPLEAYGQAGCLEFRVGPIPEAEYRAFVRAQFQTKEVVVADEVFLEAQAFSEVLGHRQLLWQAAFNEAQGGDLSLEALATAKARVIQQQDESYELLYGNLTPLQKKLLKLMAWEPEAKIYSKEFALLLGPIAGNTVVKTIQALCVQRLLYKYEGNYVLFNAFFREWIKSAYL